MAAQDEGISLTGEYLGQTRVHFEGFFYDLSIKTNADVACFRIQCFSFPRESPACFVVERNA
jgi:hypothetical protein